MVGQVISHYKILEKVGEGGMGVVYKAQDLSLDRFVALKFLPQHLSASEADKARFIQEAKAASALNHPNICTIHAIEDCDGHLFIVMELVEGQTLRERKSTLSIKQAIDIGLQIADGLAAAHEKGIVHRDIKPENIMLRKDGIAQVMDFGLAKLRSTGSGIDRLTKEGSTIGTVGYMSPEQVQGLETDHRSDIFSFGVVLYEMMTRQLPFRGGHETALMYEIVNVDPIPMSAAVPEIDPALDAIVLECLAKEPSERFQAIAEVGKELRRFKRESTRQRVSRVSAVRPLYQPAGSSTISNRLSGVASEVDIAPQSSRPFAALLPWLLSGILFLGLAFVGYLYMRPAPPVPSIPSVTAQIPPVAGCTFANEDGGHIALSPDGKMLTYVGRDTLGRSSLWVRALNSPESRSLPETDGATYPFWSPDNRSIAFFSGAKLKRIDVAGGTPTAICDAPNGRGGAWNEAGVILFAPRLDGCGISRVAASGGDPVEITHVDSSRNETNHRWPFFLPDGKHFIYTTQAKVRSNEYWGSLYVASLGDTGNSKLLLKASSNVSLVSNYILYVRKNMLTACPIDLKKLELAGDPFQVADKVTYSTDKSRGMFSASANGMLVYLPSSNFGKSLFWFDRTGKQTSAITDKPPVETATISHDGSKIALDSYDQQAQNTDVWVYDIARGVSTRLTFERSFDGDPLWSPDDSRIVFNSDRIGPGDFFIKNTNGAESEHLLLKSSLVKDATDWSYDGRFILYMCTANKGWDIAYVELSGDSVKGPETMFVQSEFNEFAGKFSPDGKWVAYQSDESGKWEVYVRAFPAGSGKWQVSVNGGSAPHWRRDGKELYFSAAGGTGIMAAEVNGSTADFHVGKITQLFALQGMIDAQFSDVTGDGTRFLMMGLAGTQASPPLTIVTNWEENLEKKQ